MPLVDRPIGPHRSHFRESLSLDEIRQLVQDPTVKVVQTDRPATEACWKLINEQLLPARPDIEIRIYGGLRSDSWDLSILRHLSEVRRLSVDCIIRADHVETIGHLRNLESLCVGIYSLESFDFLEALPNRLVRLVLQPTQSKKPGLASLGRFSGLRQLTIAGQQKGLEIIGELGSLEELSLTSVSPKDLSFLRSLSMLWALEIVFGGIRDFSGIEGMAQLKYLELSQVRGLADLSFISTLTGLQRLHLQSLRNVTDLPDASRLRALRRVYLENMKGLERVEGILKAPALEEFVHASAQNMSPEDYAGLIELPTLKRMAVCFGNNKDIAAMERMMEAKGISRYQHTPFVYR